MPLSTSQISHTIAPYVQFFLPPFLPASHTCNGVAHTNIHTLPLPTPMCTTIHNLRAPTLTHPQAALSTTYSQLTQLASTRHHRLEECKQLHRFNRDCDEVEVWIVAKETVAQNEDVGKDLEHVEVHTYTF